MNPERRPDRPLRSAVVERREQLSPQLVRLHCRSEDLVGTELPFTDHYIKIAFGDVTRTYTVRSFDSATGRMAVDFVVHGTDGLAGPWAASVEPGAQFQFRGPGGKWAPSDEHTSFVFVGDESAAPAICAALEALPAGASATVLLEIEHADATFPVPDGDAVDLRWVVRDGARPGERLAAAVRELDAPDDAAWFVHGVAEMIKDVRRLLFVERNVPRDVVSISGYWRLGLTEDSWQASKHDFVAAIEAEEQQASA